MCPPFDAAQLKVPLSVVDEPLRLMLVTPHVSTLSAPAFALGAGAVVSVVVTVLVQAVGVLESLTVMVYSTPALRFSKRGEDWYVPPFKL
jgi:hypothetical protein